MPVFVKSYESNAFVGNGNVFGLIQWIFLGKETLFGTSV
jgi:hypothetical protein